MNKNTALTTEIEAGSIQELVKEIAQFGKMTAADQARINEMAKGKLNSTDIKAIDHLTALIRDGMVKVA